MRQLSYTTPTFAYSPASYGCPVSAQNAGLTTLNCAGFQVSRTPTWSGDLGVDQSVPVATGSLEANATLNFATSRWGGTDFIPSDRWFISAIVRNATNAAIYTHAAKNPFSSLVYADIQPPVPMERALDLSSEMCWQNMVPSLGLFFSRG